MEKQFVLKAKTAVKRVAAISAGATMMGATMMGAVAADLGDYPSPFVADGELNGLVVVGSASSAGDIVGAGDLISTLTQATVSAGSATTVTEGGEDAEVALNGNMSEFDGTSNVQAVLDDGNLEGLADTDLEWNDTEIDYYETVTVTENMQLLVSGEADGEDEMGATPYLGTTSSNTFIYKFVFDEAINTGAQNLLANVDDNDDTLTIDLMGQSVEIIDMTATGFTYRLADEYSLFVGDSVTVNGKEISLVNVASSGSNVVVTVDGEQETVGTNAETVSGIKVKVSDVFYSDNLSERFAVLRVGDDISKEATDNDEVELFGGSDEDRDNPYEWDIDLNGAIGSYIGIAFDVVANELTDSTSPIAIGESFTMPNDYATVTFDSLTTNKYVDVEVTAGGSESVNDTTVEVWELASDDDEAFYIGGDKVDSVYLSLEGNASDVFGRWHYQDEDGVWRNESAVNNTDGTTASGLQVQYKSNNYMDVFLAESLTGVAGNATISFDISAVTGGSDLTIELDGSGDETLIGSAEDEAADDIEVGTTNQGSEEDDRLFTGGLILRDPEAGLQGAGSVEFEIPEEAVKANIIVTGPGAVTTTTEYSSVTVNSVAGQSVIKLDTEVTDPASRNLILVGGPAVNRLTAQAMGLNYPTTGADSGIPEGAALIRMVENAFGGSNTALVVAGWDAEDTRAAASVLQNYRSYANQLNGKMEVKVSGTSVSAVGGDVATE